MNDILVDETVKIIYINTTSATNNQLKFGMIKIGIKLKGIVVTMQEFTTEHMTCTNVVIVTDDNSTDEDSNVGMLVDKIKSLNIVMDIWVMSFNIDGIISKGMEKTIANNMVVEEVDYMSEKYIHLQKNMSINTETSYIFKPITDGHVRKMEMIYFTSSGATCTREVKQTKTYKLGLDTYHMVLSEVLNNTLNISILKNLSLDSRVRSLLVAMDGKIISLICRKNCSQCTRVSDSIKTSKQKIEVVMEGDDDDTQTYVDLNNRAQKTATIFEQSTIISDAFSKSLATLSAVIHSYATYALSSVKKYVMEDAMYYIRMMSKIILEKGGYELGRKDEHEHKTSAAALFVLATDKPNWANALNVATRYANAKLDKIRNSVIMTTLGLVSVLVLLSYDTIAAIVILSLFVLLVLMDKIEQSYILSIIVAPTPIQTKILGLLAYLLYTTDIVKAPIQTQYIILPLIVASAALSSTRYIRWDELDKMQPKTSEEIGQYWKEKGLTDGYGTASTWSAKNHPICEVRRDEEYLDVIKYIKPPEYVQKIMNRRHHSILDDEMLVKAINKRLAGLKPIAKHSALVKMRNIILQGVASMGWYKISEEDAVKAAMSTKGTAGEMAKHSLLEKQWKDVNNNDLVVIWMHLVNLTRLAVVFNTENMDPISTYQIYMKVEVLPYSEDGSYKVTRLMQAPTLPLRIADYRVMYPFNKAIEHNRFTMPAQIGMNVITELKYIIRSEMLNSYITMDMTNFDKYQHPYQLQMVRDARVLHMMMNGSDIKDIIYIIRRYELQLTRKVSYRNTITGTIIGGQASGDSTTSDDNSKRNEAYLLMVCNELAKLGFKILASYAMGDDGMIVVFGRLSNEERQIVVALVEKIAHDIGWEARDVQVLEVMPEFIAHTVIRISMRLTNSAKVQADMTARIGDRIYGKFWMSSDKKGKLNMKNMRKLASKYLSYIYMNWQRPAILLQSLYFLHNIDKIDAVSFETDNYILQNIVKEVNIILETCDLMQVHIGVPIDLESYDVPHIFLEEYKQTYDWLKKRANEKDDAAIVLVNDCEDNDGRLMTGSIWIKKHLRHLATHVMKSIKKNKRGIRTEENIKNDLVVVKCEICDSGKVAIAVRDNNKQCSTGYVCSNKDCIYVYKERNKATRRNYLIIN